jgi:hypothetical protein
MVINVPFSFEFRAIKTQWEQASARITGWGKRTDGTLDGSNLVAEITTRGVRYPIRYPRRRLPPGRWDNLWLEAGSNDDVERVFSGFEPLLLVPFGKTYVEDAEFKKYTQPADPWQMRDDFLRLAPSCGEVLAFLNEWGRWNFEEYVELSEIVHLQGAVREALVSSPEKWFQSDHSFPPTWRRSPEYPYFRFLTDKCEVAVCMTVTIDLLNELKFKTCERPDCGQPFAESRSDRRFCCKECGHLEAVRRSRKTTTTKVEG